jgi:hypothetical protein
VADQSKGERGESEKERVDRELIELLNELRVVLPGVQVLFAFLLTVPFSNGFPKMSSLQRDVYFVSFVCATIATLLLIAPTTYHRLLFRQGNKERILVDSNKLVIAGTAFLAPAMSAAVFVITDVLFHTAAAAAAAGIVVTGFAVLWYWLPLVRRRGTGGSPQPR